MLTGFDLDLARQVNQTANSIRGLYTQIHPALEAVLGPKLEHAPVVELIASSPTPAQLKRAGKHALLPNSKPSQPCSTSTGINKSSKP